MIQRIKQVLLTQYIGAIVIAFLGTDAVLNVIRIVAQIVEDPIVARVNRQSVLYPPVTRWTWGVLVPTAVTAVLQLLTAYLLFRWLYLRNQRAAQASDGEDEPSTESQRPAGL